MKNVYLVSYDVCEAKRLRQTYKKLCGFGQALQYSVFRCELSPMQLHRLKADLWEIWTRTASCWSILGRRERAETNVLSSGVRAAWKSLRAGRLSCDHSIRHRLLMRVARRGQIREAAFAF